MVNSITTSDILEYLQEVKDPEIPVLSLVDMGVITEVGIHGDRIVIEMTPTFVGCPAIDYMKADILSVLKQKGIENIEIVVSFRKPWTSDNISEKGKQALKQYGLAPPPAAHLFYDLDILENAECPRCSGTNTTLKNPFGSTLCRSIYYCNDCKEAFEQFKPI